MADGLLFASMWTHSIGTQMFTTSRVISSISLWQDGIKWVLSFIVTKIILLLISLGHEDLIQVLEEKSRKPNQRISAKLETQIKMQYKRKIQNETDMYKCAVYGIVGCCDVPDHAKVAKTTDDFLWIQLSMIQPDDNGNMSNIVDTTGADCATYSGLQTMILEKYGEKHFNANEQPHLYFQVECIALFW